MFLKTLLFLAICFQALHIGNSMRIFDKIHGGLEMGKALKVEVCDDELYPEFIVRFFNYNRGREISNIGLRLNVSAARREIVFEKIHNGHNIGPFSRFWDEAKKEANASHRMSLEIVANEIHFEILVDNESSWTWNYTELPAESLNYWEIEYRQPYEVANAIWYRKFVPCAS